jgi:hypothetical protein
VTSLVGRHSSTPPCAQCASVDKVETCFVRGHVGISDMKPYLPGYWRGAKVIFGVAALKHSVSWVWALLLHATSGSPHVLTAIFRERGDHEEPW